MKVLVCVCGGIAAYKAAEVVRLLQTRGHEVEVAMTESATHFVGAMTFAALTGRAVHTSLWEGSGSDNEFSIEHIAVMRRCDAMAIVPATANTLARMAHGFADDFVSAAFLACAKPVVIAPAMNVQMWQNEATRTNLRTLRERGVRVVEPGSGYLACGMVGDGRLAEVEEIADAIDDALHPRRDLANDVVLVTAGGTREPVDAVRFLGNRSSGRMGYAVAEAARDRGARVVLISAAALESPPDVEVVHVNTAAEMREAVLARLPEATLVVKAAAVADFRMRAVAAGKLERAAGLTLELEPTEDIIAEVVDRRRPATLVLAFAAEAGEMQSRARAKLVRKGVDAIFANDILREDTGFEAADNAGLFVTADASIELGRMSKRALADRLLDEMQALRLLQPQLT